MSNIKKKQSKFEKNRLGSTTSTINNSKKEVELTPVEKIKHIESLVLSSTENSNKILEIITICKNNLNELEIIFQGIKSLERIFLHLLDPSNEILCKEFTNLKKSSTTGNPKKQKQQETKTEEPFIIFTRWIYKIYVTYLELLISFIRHEDPSIQIPSLKSTISILVRESILTSNVPSSASTTEKESFYNISRSLWKDILSAILTSPNFNQMLLEHLRDEYLNVYQDLFYFSLAAIKDLASNNLDKVAFELKHPKITHSKFVENVFDFICLFQLFDEIPVWNFLVGKPATNLVKESSPSLQLLKKKMRVNSNGDSASSTETTELKRPKSYSEKEFTDLTHYWNVLTKCGSYKNIFGKAWVEFLTLPLPPSIYKHVLMGLPEQVFPHLSDPRVLMDFFSKSYDLGGVTSILALNGLFILINKYNLEYPEFYKKLYSLFQPGVIYAKYRARFFKLAEVFLSSKFLPNYIVAAFIKRCANLCLVSPPFGSLILIPLIYNLLQRHPNCHCLINNTEYLSEITKKKHELQKKKQQQLQQQQGVLLISKKQDDIELNEEDLILGLYGNDEFLVNEEDPAKCNALKSSLWEIQILRDHYSPDVSKMAKIFDSHNIKNTINPEDFLQHSYQNMYDSSYKKKSTPILAYQQKPELINPEKDLLEGWKF
eukprot:gene9275-11367_t